LEGQAEAEQEQEEKQTKNFLTHTHILARANVVE